MLYLYLLLSCFFWLSHLQTVGVAHVKTAVIIANNEHVENNIAEISSESSFLIAYRTRAGAHTRVISDSFILASPLFIAVALLCFFAEMQIGQLPFNFLAGFWFKL